MKSQRRSRAWVVTTVSGIVLVLAGCARQTGNPVDEPAKKGTKASVDAAAEVTTVLAVDPRVKGSGLEVNDGGTWREHGVGQPMKIGDALRTKQGVRTRVALKDGSVLHLNDSTEVSLAGQRELKLTRGEVYAEVMPVAGKPLHIDTGAAKISVTGTKLNVKADDGQTIVDVTRGTVEISGSGATVEVGAGERAVVRKGAPPRVSISRDLGLVTNWAREMEPPKASEKALARGFGSLTARVPGQGKSHALSLASHQVRVVVQDNIARTEIEQRYYNASGQTLEGTYRFPLPAGASISRLALYVGNRLEEGEVVERHRARAIFRKIVEDSIRPRDPALLEWVGGRMFRMKIFPIPPRSARRVILAYTQTLEGNHGRYQYVYPMSTSRGKATRVGRFSVEVKAAHSRGLDSVKAPLYPVLTEKDNDGTVRLRYEATKFVPAASFVANIAPRGEAPELQLALYEPKQRMSRCAVTNRPVQVDARIGTAATTSRPAHVQPCGDRGGFFMATLRPELPTGRRAQKQDLLFVLDSSYGTGKRGWQTQRAVLEAFLAEMDLGARFNVLACDARCQALGPDFVAPTTDARRGALAFVQKIQPGGSSDLQGAFAEAAVMAGKSKRVHVIYVGDGRPTAGELREPQLARLVVNRLGAAGARLTALQTGDDVGALFLAQTTRRLGGAVITLHPGDNIRERVFEVVAAQYRPTLTDISIELEGVDAHSIYPRQLPSIPAGGEVVLVGRYGRGGKGMLHVRGRLDGRAFVRRYPVELLAAASERQANTFIPRLWGKNHLDALTVDDYDRFRPEIVRISKAYTVLSRATAFLVLENERMYREFRVKRNRNRTYWKGDKIAVRTGKDQPATTAAPKATTRSEAAKAVDGRGLLGGLASKGGGSAASGRGKADDAPAGGDVAAREEAKPRSMADAADDKDEAEGEEAGPAPAAPAAEPRATRARRAPAMKAKRSMASEAPLRKPSTDSLGTARPRPPRRWERRRVSRAVWVNNTRISPVLSIEPSASLHRSINQLATQLQRRPLSRSLHRRYHRALVKAGNFNEAMKHAAQWTELEGRRVEALRALADAEAQLLGAAAAMRTYSSQVEVQPWSSRSHRALAAMYRNKGELRRSCSHLWSLVSLAPKRLERHLELARCLAGAGERTTALKVLTEVSATPIGRKSAAKIGRVLASIQAGDTTAVRPSRRHALEINATWNQPEDLDLVLITPRGERVSVLYSRRGGSLQRDSRDGRQAELLGLRWARNGDYRVEVVYSGAGQPKHPISGTVLVKVHGKTKIIPFVLSERSRPLAKLSLQRRRTIRHYYR